MFKATRKFSRKNGKTETYWAVEEIVPDDLFVLITTEDKGFLRDLNKYRNETDPEKKHSRKEALPAFFLQYESHIGTDLKKTSWAGFSKWHVIDLDVKDNPELEKPEFRTSLKMFLQKYPDCLGSWESPSHGIKAIFRTVDAQNEAHFKQIQVKLHNRIKELGLVPDENQATNSNLKCYQSFDPEAVHRPVWEVVSNPAEWTYQPDQEVPKTSGIKAKKVSAAPKICQVKNVEHGKIRKALLGGEYTQKVNVIKEKEILADYIQRVNANTVEGTRHPKFLKMANKFGSHFVAGQVSNDAVLLLANYVKTHAAEGEKEFWTILDGVANSIKNQVADEWKPCRENPATISKRIMLSLKNLAKKKAQNASGTVTLNASEVEEATGYRINTKAVQSNLQAFRTRNRTNNLYQVPVIVEKAGHRSLRSIFRAGICPVLVSRNLNNIKKVKPVESFRQDPAAIETEQTKTEEISREGPWYPVWDDGSELTKQIRLVLQED